jgi:hypothetical protein
LIRIEIDWRTSAGLAFELSLLFALGLGSLFLLPGVFLLAFRKSCTWSW